MKKWLATLFLVVLLLALTAAAFASTVFETVEDAADYVLQCRDTNQTDFDLDLGKEAFDEIKNDKDAFFALCGIRTADVRPLSAKRHMTFSNVVWGETIVIVDSMDAAYAEVARQLGQPSIELYCTSEFYTYLMKDVTGLHFRTDVMMPLIELTAHSGIFDFDIRYQQQKHLIVLDVNKLYPGTEILLAVNNGTESELTGRLPKTLAEARRAAEECRRDTDLDTALAIHDWLCERIEYTLIDWTDDDDTAIGAILDGKANCDGYADGFLLIGTLAGLEVRYQHGDSVPDWRTGFGGTETHMWNLLCLDGTWRMVDLTWDDGEYGIARTWFNIGEDRAARTHEWRHETTVPMLPQTDLSTRPENEYYIADASDIAAAIRDADEKSYPTYSLYFAAAENAIAWRVEALSCLNNVSYVWNDKMCMLTVIR